MLTCKEAKGRGSSCNCTGGQGQSGKEAHGGLWPTENSNSYLEQEPRLHAEPFVRHQENAFFFLICWLVSINYLVNIYDMQGGMLGGLKDKGPHPQSPET